MKRVYLLIAVMALLAVGQTAQGAVYQSCDQWASYSDGTYTVWNNVWGATGTWSQCLTCTSATQWYIDASHTNGSQVKSYANTSRGVNQTIGNLSSFSSSMSTSSPGTGTYNLSWDIWAPGEVMVWLARYGGAAPWGSYVSTQSISGRTWDVYKNGYPGFISPSNTSSETVNMKAILDYCVSQGWLSSGNTVNNLGGGFEIWDTAGATRRYTMNSFSASFATGGSTTTTAATTTTTAASTSTSTTSASTSTTTTASSTSTTSATTTTTSGGSCSCGTCSWYGSQIPTCCQACSGWGWQDGGCNRSCVCSGSCPNN